MKCLAVFKSKMHSHRASVSRIKRMHNIVDKDTVETFSKAAIHLIKIEDFMELIQEDEKI